MEIVLEVETKRELREDDVIVRKGGKWKVISKESFFAEQFKWNMDCEAEIKQLQNDLVELAKIVKEK